MDGAYVYLYCVLSGWLRKTLSLYVCNAVTWCIWLPKIPVLLVSVCPLKKPAPMSLPEIFIGLRELFLHFFSVSFHIFTEETVCIWSVMLSYLYFCSDGYRSVCHFVLMSFCVMLHDISWDKNFKKYPPSHLSVASLLFRQLQLEARELFF